MRTCGAGGWLRGKATMAHGQAPSLNALALGPGRGHPASPSPALSSARWTRGLLRWVLWGPTRRTNRTRLPWHLVRRRCRCRSFSSGRWFQPRRGRRPFLSHLLCLKGRGGWQGGSRASEGCSQGEVLGPRGSSAPWVGPMQSEPETQP